jgi:hypothetical protein
VANDARDTTGTRHGPSGASWRRESIDRGIRFWWERVSLPLGPMAVSLAYCESDAFRRWCDGVLKLRRGPIIGWSGRRSGTHYSFRMR